MTRVTRAVLFAILLVSPSVFASSTLMGDALSNSGPGSTTMEQPLPELQLEAAPSATRTAQPVVTMGEVVVTASRVPTPRREVPDTVSVVTRSDLKPGNALDLGDAVERTAGVDVARYAGPGSLSTISIRGSRASQVLVMQDGRPLNSVSSGETNVSVVPAGAIERVEVLRGPSGLLYGSSPLGGVVNVITPRPPHEFRGSIEGQDGTYGTRVTRAAAGGPIGPVRLLLRDERTRTDGARPNGAAWSEDTMLKAEALENPRIEVQAGAFDDRLGVPGPMPATDPLERSGTQAFFGNAMVTSLVDRQADRRRYVMTGVEYRPCGLGEVSVRHYAEDNWLESFYGTAGWGNPTLSTNRMTTRIMGLEGQCTAGPWEAEHARLTVGGSWRRERLKSDTGSFDTVTGADTVTQGIRGAAETSAGFAELALRPAARLKGTPGVPPLEGLTLAGGVRHDLHSIFGNVTNGHAGAAWEIGKTTARVSAGDTFRAPTLNDLKWPQDAYSGGNPDLKPERGRVFEWSVERSADGFTGRVGAYARKVRGQIDWAPDATGKWQPHNVGLVRARGEEAECSFEKGRIRVNASLTTIRAVQRQAEVAEFDTMTGAPTAYTTRERASAHTPAYTAGGSLTVRLPWGTEIAGAIRNSGTRLMYIEQDDWMTGKATYATKRLKPVMVATVRAAKRLGKRSEAYLGVENLTDARYAARFGNSVSDQDYPAPPRTWFAGARVSW